MLILIALVSLLDLSVITSFHVYRTFFVRQEMLGYVKICKIKMKTIFSIHTLLVNRNCVRNYCQQLSPFKCEFEKNRIETNIFQKSVLAAGSALVSILNPRRGDTIAILGETTGDNAARYMLRKMLNSDEGSKIINEQPRINTNTVNIKYLESLPEGTLGKLYSNFLEKNQVTPDSRLPVQFMDDVELAYVIQRYREVHDLVHTVLLMPTNMLGEVTVKWVEAIQTKLPMCIGGAIFGPVRLKPKHRQLYLNHYLPWALKTGLNAQFLMNIYFEKRWEQPMDQFYNELKITPLVLPQKPAKKGNR